MLFENGWLGLHGQRSLVMDARGIFQRRQIVTGWLNDYHIVENERSAVNRTRKNIRAWLRIWCADKVQTFGKHSMPWFDIEGRYLFCQVIEFAAQQGGMADRAQQGHGTEGGRVCEVGQTVVQQGL
ncbi:MAG: hypothetical protein OEV15_09995, partial [Gallionella sp.]|nr:hypothetical protein [Gallionella sp.]